MSLWTANYVNDPSNDYEVVLEILYDDADVAVIRRADDGLLEIEWYPHDASLLIPFNWLHDLLVDATRNLNKS